MDRRGIPRWEQSVLLFVTPAEVNPWPLNFDTWAGMNGGEGLAFHPPATEDANVDFSSSGGAAGGGGESDSLADGEVPLGTQFDPEHHNLVASLYRGGEIISQRQFVSGNIRPAEIELANRQGLSEPWRIGDTENRAVRASDLQSGDLLVLDGQFPPCESCMAPWPTDRTRPGLRSTTEFWMNLGTRRSGPPSKGATYMQAMGQAAIDELVRRIRVKLAKDIGRPAQIGPSPAELHPPVSVDQLAEQEMRLGFALLPLLRRLYGQMANGGFGPGHGLLLLRQLSPRVDHSVATLYHQLHGARVKRGAVWVSGVVPFCQWGDIILSCVDLSNGETAADPPVVRYEPNMPEAATYGYLGTSLFLGAGLIPEAPTLSKWFEDWLVGKEMFRRPYTDPKAQ